MEDTILPVVTNEERESIQLMSFIADKRAELADLEKSSLSLKEINETLTSSIKEKELVQNELDASIAAKQSTLTSIEQETVKLTLAKEDVARKFEKLKQKNEDELLGIEARKDSLLDDLNGVEGALNRAQTQLTELNHEVELKLAESTSFDVLIKQKTEALETAVNSLSSKIGELESTITQLKDEETTLRNTLVLLQDELTEKKRLGDKEIANLSEEYEAHKAKLLESLNLIEAKKNELTLNVHTLEEKRKIIGAELIKFSEEVREKKESINAEKRSILLELGKVIQENNLSKLPDSVQDAIRNLS